MTTRAKLNLSSGISSTMMLLIVFSKPLHIPEPIQWVLMLGVFIPLGLLFYFIKKQKQERLAPAGSVGAAPPAAESVKKTRKRLILLMVIGVVIGLCTPFWMPLTGTTNGPMVDLICGLVTALIVCIIFGLRLRKLR